MPLIPPGSTIVRPAAEHDAAGIASVLRAAFAPYRSFYTDAAFAATVLDEEQVRRRIAEGPVWIAAYGQRTLGTVAAIQQGEDFWLRGMSVMPDAAGLGIGRQLLAHAEATAWSRNQRRIVLSTTPFLDRAIRLYERAGFSFAPEGPLHLHGTELRTMVKALIRPEVTDDSTADHYSWAEGGEGWHFVRRAEISVIRERMLPGTSETPHFHTHSSQFFFVYRGTATIVLAGAETILRPAQGIHVPAGLPHVIRNTGGDALEFVVVSTPASHTDRINT